MALLEKIFGQTSVDHIKLNIAVIVAVLCGPEFVTARAATLDYLVPSPNKRAPYDSEIRSRFFRTPFNCGRYFEDTDASVSVYLTKPGDRAFVTAIMSSQDLLNVPASKHKAITYRRVDREIPKATAVAVRNVWRHMLERRFLTEGEINSSNVAALDDLSGQFSLEVEAGSVLRADLPNGSKVWNAHVRRFWELGILLFRYCTTENAERRATLGEQIEKKSARLSTSLEKELGRNN